jgi:hypothetical protein
MGSSARNCNGVSGEVYPRFKGLSDPSRPWKRRINQGFAEVWETEMADENLRKEARAINFGLK